LGKRTQNNGGSKGGAVGKTNVEFSWGETRVTGHASTKQEGAFLGGSKSKGLLHAGKSKHILKKVQLAKTAGNKKTKQIKPHQTVCGQQTKKRGPEESAVGGKKHS